MKNSFWKILCATLLLTMVGNVSHAQFWKKRSKRKKKQKIVYPLPEDKRLGKPVNESKPEVVRRPVSIYPKTQIKNRYRVDLLAPLYLSELVKDDRTTFSRKVPSKVEPSILFYEGVSLAIDTLEKMGYQLDIFVHDVKDSILNTETLINTGALDASDLLIGTMSSKDFQHVARFAKRKNINFISALSPSDAGIRDNEYFTMLQPTLLTHCDAIKTRMYRKYGNTPVTLLYRTNVSIDKRAYESFVNDNDVVYKPLSCNTMPTYEQLKPLFSGNISNVILVPIINDRYVSDMLEKLYEWFPEYQFDVWGMPSWDDMPSLQRSDAYPNVAVYFTRPFYFDYTTASGQALLKKYKSTYGVAPDNLVYRGYETMMWYAYLLNKYGTIFNTSMRDNGGAPFTRFDMITNKSDNGELLYHENKNVYLYRYQSSSYMIQR